MNKPKIYFSAEIRGLEGEDCPWDTQIERIKKAIQVCNVYRDYFPQYEFVCPHENYIVNELVRKGLVDGDNIVDIECEWILSGSFSAVLVLEPCHCNTGVEREADAGNQSCRTIYVKDGDEPSRNFFAQQMAMLLLDNVGVGGCEL